VAEARLRTNSSTQLSQLEERCLRLYGAGWNRSEISAMVRVSARTVGNSLTVAKEKLGARSLAQAALLLETRTVAVLGTQSDRMPVSR